MSDERPTVRPVTLSRLVETAFLAREVPVLTSDIETELTVSTRRARESLLEAERTGLIRERGSDGDEPQYDTTTVGKEFVSAIEAEDWSRVDKILRTRSPHYGAFLEVVDDHGPIEPAAALAELEDRSTYTPYSYNETSLDIVGNWAQRLGVIQRHAFTGTFYVVDRDSVPNTFPYQLVTTAEEIEETAGIDLRQQYLSIPELREELCQRIGCSRSAFDSALTKLAEENVGRLELSGAPIDTGAKDARYGIKTISLADDDGIVTTEQSSEQVMRGVELLGKQYYYLAVHDTDLSFNKS